MARKAAHPALATGTWVRHNGSQRRKSGAHPLPTILVAKLSVLQLTDWGAVSALRTHQNTFHFATLRNTWASVEEGRLGRILKTSHSLWWA